MTTGVVVNIRPASYRARFHDAFNAIGWPIIDAPVLAPESLGCLFPPAPSYDAIIFTSQVAVELLSNAAAWHEKIAYAVGAATADAARGSGFTRVIQTGGDAKDLADVLSAAGFKRAFYPSAEEVSADVSLGDPVRIHRLAVYRMIPSASLPEALLSHVRSGRPVIVPLFSRRSARTFERLLKNAEITKNSTSLIAVAISEEVSPPETGPWQRWAVADTPTMESIAAKTTAIATDIIAGAHP